MAEPLAQQTPRRSDGQGPTLPPPGGQRVQLPPAAADIATSYAGLKVDPAVFAGRDRSVTDKLKAQYAEVMQGAMGHIGAVNPALLEAMRRPGVNIVLVADIHQAVKDRFGITVDKAKHPNLTGYTYTQTNPADGKATGTTILIDEGLFRGIAPGDKIRPKDQADPRAQIARRDANAEYFMQVALAITTVDHELQHLTRKDNPPVGQVPAKISEAQAEYQAYRDGAADMRKIITRARGFGAEDFVRMLGALAKDQETRRDAFQEQGGK
jgi:hypothetical protein